jgi:uncharacterized protein (DUF3084 family)
MAYITKNANLVLLLLIVLIAGSLVGATVYFQHRFGNINAEYDQKLAELNNLTAQVENYQQVLEKAQIELELKQSREEEFTDKFTTEKDRAENLEDELAETLGLLTVKSAEVEKLTVDVNNLQVQVSSKDDKINDLEEKVDCLEDTADLEEDDC